MSRYILSNVGVCDETTGHRVVWIADSDGTCRRYILHTGSFAAFTHDRCLTPTVINDAHPAMPYREFVAIMDASRGDNARNYAPARDGSWHKLTSPTRRRHNIIACTLRMSARMRRRYAHADAGVIVWMSHASNCGDVIAVDYTGVIPRGARVLTCGNMQRTLGCIIVRNGRSDSGFASALRPRLSPSSSLVMANAGASV